MSENIATINEFLTRGELRLNRDGDIYQIVHVFEDGKAQTWKNVLTHPDYTQITLTEEEIAELASLCFSPTQQAGPAGEEGEG